MTTNEFTIGDGRFTIKSFGNGWAYEMTDNTTNGTLWFQDQDAEFLRDQSADFSDIATVSMFFEMLCE
jgi:hypothetical protein